MTIRGRLMEMFEKTATEMRICGKRVFLVA